LSIFLVASENCGERSWPDNTQSAQKLYHIAAKCRSLRRLMNEPIHHLFAPINRILHIEAMMTHLEVG
jgi:hypothetical protein